MSEATLTQKRPLPLNILITLFIVIWVVLAAFPFLWTVWGSFKVEPDFFSRESWWNAILGTYTERQTGAPVTGAGYYGAWVTREFWRAAGNTAIVTISVTVISLTLGTLGGYALARSGQRYAFWILIIALVFLYFIAAIFVFGGELNAAIIKSRLPHGVSLQAAQSLAPAETPV